MLSARVFGNPAVCIGEDAGLNPCGPRGRDDDDRVKHHALAGTEDSRAVLDAELLGIG
jgi:hypothetical protein